MKKNRDILKKAISGLPEYRLPDAGLWNRMEKQLPTITDAEKTELDQQLPRYKAPERVWENIEATLDKQNRVLRKAVEKLPQYKAPEGIWEEVEQDLEKTKHIRFRGSFRRVYRIAIAASIALLAGYGIWQMVHNHELEGELVYSSEIIENNERAEQVTDDEVDKILDDKIAQHCSYQPLVCEKTEYKKLEEELKEIKQEHEELKSVIEKNPSDQLYKYLYRLENEKVEIQKQMIRFFNQS